ncbi:MAG: DUF4430 domain-containing protein [Actinomycetota bacterium]|nr:DUF4430 domain-containing protein [Actinomycetota bacterium]
MPYSVSLRHLALLFALCLPLLLTDAAAAAVKAHLRVEGPRVTLDRGSTYVTGTERVRKATPDGCRPTPRRARVAGPTALGIVQSAINSGRRASDALMPLRVQTFPGLEGLFTCRIGDYVGSASAFWLYKVNHVFPTVGADQFRLDRGDQVLWYFADFDRGINTGDELGLNAPRRADAGDPFPVKVVAFAGDGSRSPAEGATVRGGDVPVETNARGRARVTISDAGRAVLKARRGSDIPSEREIVRVR